MIENRARSATPGKGVFSLVAGPLAPNLGVVRAYLPESAVVVAASPQALGLEVHFDAERPGVRVLSSAQVRERSRGQVKDAAGLGSQRIFGPEWDYECACGKYTRMKHRGVVCEVCGVEVIQSTVRRKRFGHLELPHPCVHPLFGGEAPPRVLEAVPVRPPELRPAPSVLDERYLQALRARSPDQTQRAVDELFAVLSADIDAVWSQSLAARPSRTSIRPSTTRCCCVRSARRRRCPTPPSSHDGAMGDGASRPS